MAMKLNSEYHDRVWVPNLCRNQEKNKPFHEELRRATYRTRAPSGNVSLQCGYFTPDGDNESYRSVGAWFEKKFAVPDEEPGTDFGKGRARQFWPYGDQIVRLKGATELHTYKLDDFEVRRLIPEHIKSHTIKEAKIPVGMYEYPLPLRRTHEY